MSCCWIRLAASPAAGPAAEPTCCAPSRSGCVSYTESSRVLAFRITRTHRVWSFSWSCRVPRSATSIATKPPVGLPSAAVAETETSPE